MQALIIAAVSIYAVSMAVVWLYAIPRICKMLEAHWPDGN